MNAAMRFTNALDADRCGDRAHPGSLPHRLVRAAAVALPVAGAVLCVLDEQGLRIPLADSGEIAATVERLEFTTGCGPSLAAVQTGLPVFGTESVLAQRWPILHDLLATGTEVRSTLALPLPGWLRGLGSMDLYFRDPAGPMAIDVVEARALCALVAAHLEAAERSAATPAGGPAWLDTSAARRRGRLWTAVGMVIAGLQVSAEDALALLRGHAYATDRTVDDLALDLLDRRTAPDELRGHTPPIGPTARAEESDAHPGRFPNRPSTPRQQSWEEHVVGSASRDAATWDGHVLLLHSTEQERREELTAWMRRGLELGEKIIYTEPADGPDQPLRAVLEAGGVDVATAIRDGQLVVVPPGLSHPPAGRHGLVERALAEGFPGVRVSAGEGAAPVVLPPAAYRESERRMDELIRTKPVSAMCQHARSTTTAAWLGDLVAAHLTGVHESTLATGGSSDGLTLRGEIDTANADVFDAVLAAANHATTRALRLDLADVTYLDAGTGRRLDDATRPLRAAGGQVQLVAPQPQVERTLRCLDLDDLPGMQLVGDEP